MHFNTATRGTRALQFEWQENASVRILVAIIQIKVDFERSDYF